MIKPFKAGITGTGSMLPDKKLTNFQLESIVETSDEWIVKRTGIRERRIIDDSMPLAELAAGASNRAIADAGIAADDIDLIIATTITPDYLSPSLACQVQKLIGAGKAAAFDMNAACTGFIYALQISRQFIENGTYKNILIVSAEALSRIVDFTDRRTCVLFGDGAGAVVLGRVDDGTGISSAILGACGEDGSVLTIPCFYATEEDLALRNEGKKQVIWMDGSEVFTFASKIMSESTKNVLDDSGISINDIKYIFPHQANMRILQNAAKRLDVPMDKVYTNLEYTGNISSASVPVCLDEAAKKGLLKKGDKLILVAFGGGLTYGAALLTWSK
ncbi:MAG TPA: ketoacyl-ACP synthase III [Clostridiaceae bacterium]|jgi:3-oxoacyl-[acyl-carrier-protein] synthase-3|nr:ketoacyl-ACP synthase III [Clostridiaceae bacterium]